MIRELPLTSAPASHETYWSPTTENRPWDVTAMTRLTLPGQPQNNLCFRDDSAWERPRLVASITRV